MFRRKEDSLFDNTTDPNQEQEGSSSQAQAGGSQSSSYQGSASSQSSGSSGGYNQSAPRPPASSQGSNAGFRSAQPSPLSSDLGRNRMPEAGNKPHAPSIAPAASGPIPSPTASAAPVDNKAPSKTKAGQRVLTVGNDILLKGEIATCDRLVIEGKVDATLNDVHTVEIAEGGSFKGSASIEDAEISGLFEGDLIVRNRLVIYSSGIVRGTITYGEIQIERGGELTGEIKCNMSGSAASSASRSNRQKKENKEAA